ncbi:hypothetical protein ACSSS7_003569 [Eimeria intestinalis]
MEGSGELVTLEEGWARLRVQGIEKVQRFLEQRPERSQTTERVSVVSNEDYAAIYTDCCDCGVFTKVLPSLENRRGPDLLEELLRRWDNHRTLVKWLQKFFAYLDRYYVKMYMEAPLVKRGIAIFKDHVFERVKQPVSAAIEDAIRRQREGESLDEESIAQLVCMYIGLDPEEDSLNLYQRELEDLLLASTKQFYDRKAKEWIATSTFAEYLQLAEAALEAEAHRCERYLHSSTSSKLLGVVVKSTLQQHQQELLSKDTAIPFLLAGERRAELRMAHRLFALVDGAVEALAKQFKMYISACGEKLVQQRVAALREIQQLRAQGSSNSSSSATLSQQQQRQQDIAAEHRFVESVLDLHDKFKSITLDCFRAQQHFPAETAGPSARPTPQADSLFQKALKEGERMGDEEIEKCLMKVVEIFNYVTDKDLFAEQYRTQLGRRLLHETSASLELERLLISKLRLKCGAHFTAKVEGMCFSCERHCGAVRNAAPDLRLPAELAQCVSAFEQFYTSQTQHRKLTWVNSLGTALVAAELQKRQDLICNTMQATLLLRFNRQQGDSCTGSTADPELSLQQLVDSLRIDELTVKKLLGSLMFGRFKIIKKTEDGMFQVNESFSCLHRKIKLPTPVQEETQCRGASTNWTSGNTAVWTVVVFLVLQSLSHQQLVGEVMAQLHFFQPPPKLLKERIQDLIAREFLERDKEKPTQYNYVA